MNLPETVKWKLSKITAFLMLITAVSGIEIPAAFSETVGNKAIKAGLLADR